MTTLSSLHNFRNRTFPWIAASAVVVAALVATGCGGGGDDEDPNNGFTCVGGCPSEGITAVNNDSRASRLADAIAEASTAAVPAGTYTNRVVTGLSGSASFTGSSSFTNGACGTDCVSSLHSTNVTVVFSGYRVKVGSDEVTLTGTVAITDTRSSRQSGQNFSSGGSIGVQSQSVTARHAMTQTNGQVWGEQDTVALSVASATGGNWSGAIRGANGVAYSF